MRFEEIIGNEKLKEQLGSLIEASRIPHAIIIEGDEGMGKKTLAREIALALVCSAEGEKPCRACTACSKVKKGIHPDVVFYSGSGKSGAISVDTVRQLISDAYLKPNEAAFKVLVLEECTNMLAPAQNALLKILEEPPEYAVLILCTKTKSVFLQTVLSRSVVFKLEGVDEAQGAKYICEKNPDITPEEAQRALAITGKNIGKALETLGDGKLKKIMEIANSVAIASIQSSEYELIKACAVFERDNKTLISAATLLKSVFRDALLYESSAEMLSSLDETAALLSSRLTADKLIKMIKACDDIITFAKGNGNNALLITKLCYELRRAQGR